MFTEFDQTTILYQIVNASPLMALIDGDIYKYQRPLNSTKKDIVINSTTIEGSISVIQRGVANVNFHAPNLSNGRPDTLFFQQVSDQGKVFFESYNSEKFNFWADGPGRLIKDESLDQWLMNFRLRFKFHNTQI